jgi:4'-phosphopantetheinyl transferase
MPIAHRFNFQDDTQVLIWEIEESMEALQKDLPLSVADSQQWTLRKHLLHKKGLLASRKLLLSAGISPQNLYHDPDGIPHLESGPQLSISHSKTVAGIALGRPTLGFDLEFYHPKIEAIAPRIMHPKEAFAAMGDLRREQLTLLWTAKEALYKAAKQKGLIFSEQLCVDAFRWGEKNGSAKVLLPEKTLDFSLIFILEKYYCATLAIQND